MHQNTPWSVWLITVVYGAWAIVSGDSTIAMAKTPLSVEDVLNVQEFAPLTPITFSRDGTWLAYTVQDSLRKASTDLASYARTGVAPWNVGTHICVLNLTTGESKTLVDGRSNNWLPKWSPDGTTLAFLSDRNSGGQARLWIWDRLGDQAREISARNIRGSQIEWTPDSEKVLVTTAPDDLSLEDFVARVAGQAHADGQSERRVSGPTVLVYSSGDRQHSLSVEQSGPWNLDLSLRDLVVADARDGTVKTIVHGKRISAFFLAPDGSRVAYTSPVRFETLGSQQVIFELALVHLVTKVERVVTTDLRLDPDGEAFSWSPDGAHLAYCMNQRQGLTVECDIASAQESKQNLKIFQASIVIPSKPPRPLWDSAGHVYFASNGVLWRASSTDGASAQSFRVSNREITYLIPQSSSSLWLQAGMTTVVVVHDSEGKQDGFYKMDLNSGESVKLLENAQCYTCSNVPQPFLATENGRAVFYFAEDAGHEQELWVTNRQFQEQRRLSHLNPQFDEHALGTARLVHWLGDDGQSLQGALLLPAQYKEGDRYPLVVWVYGGVALSNNLDRFGLAYSGPFNMQLLAAHGYAVLLPDAPQRLGTPMLDLAKTVLPGVNRLVELGIADPDRMALAGHSYGGYSVLSLLVQTRRFKAAIVADGTGSLLSAYGQMGSDGSALGISIEEIGQGLMGSTPWEARDRYVENSPIFYLDRIETPLLIAEGSDDTTVPSFLTDEVFVGLRRLNKEVEYVKYAAEGHSPLSWRYPNQVDLCTRMLEWLDFHLKK